MNTGWVATVGIIVSAVVGCGRNYRENHWRNGDNGQYHVWSRRTWWSWRGNRPVSHLSRSWILKCSSPAINQSILVLPKPRVRSSECLTGKAWHRAATPKPLTRQEATSISSASFSPELHSWSENAESLIFRDGLRDGGMEKKTFEKVTHDETDHSFW